MREQARQEAELPLEEIVAKDPASALYLHLATRLVERGRLDEAIQLCEERRNRPGHGVGDHIVLGRAYLADGRLNEARAELDAALTLDRENVVALKALAGILSHLGDHDRAAGYYRAVCRIDPGDLESQTALHQITSGEFSEVRPADVIVGQGELSWQPVRLPREEEHLPELGLGLRTIEKFDAPPPPVPYRAKVQDFQEVPLDRFAKLGSVQEKPSPAADAAPKAEAPVEAPVADRVETPEPAAGAVTPAPAKPVAPEPVASAPAAASAPPPSSAPDAAASASKQGVLVQGNRSAFEQWVRRLGGKGS